MAAPLDLDPSSSVLAYFGSELRRYRIAAGLSQERLGEIVNYTGALVGLIETAKRTPSREFAELCDAALGTEGALSRLWPLVNRGSFPSWFRGYVELEAAATSIQWFEPQNVPGLLQTEDYARALIQACWSDSVEQQVSARMERQRVLDDPTSPVLWTILDEAVLHRPVGGREIMRGQLRRLADLMRAQRIVLQVLPFEAGAHACSDGAMIMLGFSEGPDVVYIEGYGSGQLVNLPEEVKRCRLRYDLARAAALSPEASAAKIEALMEGP
ncbi:helix-turn-helix domain-containing protein [Actinocrinis puniceicyclus]|uniref:Helix-turn-helix domain-containing protein n=1 Tax=Actinocrinis puniceicyclus TaxID=977794 RepID=A0A8J7WQ19_9ACTN|nr:helix-turn-helix transcriptional regulator [Actinocrinis puniceicyclus]MBS2966571.1 helix-turn-helix domain-containing protein [Actinocrinis puniceicyclus]